MKSRLLAVLVLLLVPALVSAVDSGNGYVTLFFDDLDTENPHWEYNAPKPSTHILRDGYVFLNVSGTEISSLHERETNSWLYTGIEIRLRQSSLQTYRPCGYYTNENRLRFCYLDNKSSPWAQGLHAETKIDGKNVLWEPIEGIDITDWHTYTVIWEENNGTFLIDGEIVAHTDQVPTKKMEIWTYLRPLYVTHTSVTQSEQTNLWDPETEEYTQIDYIRIFTTAERFQTMDTEITGLLPHAHQLIEDLGQRDEDTTQLEAIYAEAQDNWQEDHYFYDEAKPRLEKIIGAVEHWDEIKAIFAQASECIETLKEKGDTRNENICRAYYTNAESTWEECDYQATQSTLNNIITKCPEPTFLTILGLILLPALLRCNRSNHRTGTTCECLQ